MRREGLVDDKHDTRLVEDSDRGTYAVCSCGWRSSSAPASDVTVFHLDRHQDESWQPSR